MRSPVPGFRRVLTLPDLLIYGMIVMQVVAPVPIFGLLERRSGSHSVLTALIAMAPMLVTAVSYGRMATLYPEAGSAYTYIGRSFNPYLGFLTGWSMFLDYLMIPIVSAIIPALALRRILPDLPFHGLTFGLIAIMTLLNLRGIRATLRANTVLLVLASMAVAGFLILATRYIALEHGWGGIFALAPVYDPVTFNARAILGGISLAALTYIGFDGLTTLAEDSINPRRDLVVATVLVVLITGLLSAIELYALHSVLPDWRTTDPETSYLDVMRIVGGWPLFVTFMIIMSASQFGAGLSVQVSAARLLYGMGRDRLLPAGFFAYLSPLRQNPSRNIIFVGALAYLGTVLVQFDDALDLLNFGAFIGYMGVNLACAWSYYFRPPEEHRPVWLWDLVFPIGGFAGCLVFWLGLPTRAKVIGSLWLAAGVVYCAFKTRGFRNRPSLPHLQST